MTVRFTLWNEKARSFNMQEYEESEKLATIAVTSCTVKNYGGKYTTLHARAIKLKKYTTYMLPYAGLQLSSTAATYWYLNPDIPEAIEIRSV